MVWLKRRERRTLISDMPIAVLHDPQRAKGAVMAVMIGIDPHKGSHTAVALADNEEPLGELRVRTAGAVRPPDRAALGSSSSSRSARRSPSPASTGTPATTPTRPAPRRRPSIPYLPFIARRTIGAQRRPHRVTRHAQPSADRLDPHPLRPMQPTDLSPIIHVDHSPCLLARIEPGFAFHHIQWWTRHRGSRFGCRLGVSFSAAADTPFRDCRRTERDDRTAAPNHRRQPDRGRSERH